MTKHKMKQKVTATMIAWLLFLSIFAVLGTTANAAPLNGWQNQNERWYYYQNGAVQTGWLKDNSVWYYLNPNSEGAMVSDDYLEIDGYWYYFAASGRLIQNGWHRIKGGDWDGRWIKAYPSGALIKGWLKEGNSWYYLTPFMYDGEMGHTDDFISYYFNKGGAIRTQEGWFQGKIWPEDPDSYWFYANAGGVLKEGWFKYNNNWYYLRPYMVANRVIDIDEDGKFYYFNDQGVCRTQAGWIRAAYSWEDTLSWYYVQNGGSLREGWLKYNNKWYYLNPAMLLNGTYEIGGKNNAFDANGVWVP